MCDYKCSPAKKKKKIPLSFFDNGNLESSPVNTKYEEYQSPAKKKTIPLSFFDNKHLESRSPVTTKFEEYPNPTLLFGTEKDESNNEFHESSVKEEEEDNDFGFLPYF